MLCYNYVALHYLHCITLRYILIALCFLCFNYVALRYLMLNYVTLPKMLFAVFFRCLVGLCHVHYVKTVTFCLRCFAIRSVKHSLCKHNA